MLSRLNDDNTNVFNKSLIDRYQHRPRELQFMCLPEFAATFVTNYRQSEDSECATYREPNHVENYPIN